MTQSTTISLRFQVTLPQVRPPQLYIIHPSDIYPSRHAHPIDLQLLQSPLLQCSLSLTPGTFAAPCVAFQNKSRSGIKDQQKRQKVVFEEASLNDQNQERLHVCVPRIYEDVVHRVSNSVVGWHNHGLSLCLYWCIQSAVDKSPIYSLC